MRYLISFSMFILLFIISGCSTKETQITLLPEDSGKIGTISIANNKGENIKINKAYSSLKISQEGNIEEKLETEELITSKYSEVLNALPPKHQSTLFYFSSNKAELNPDQIKEIKNIIKTIKNNDIVQVVCIGHTDSDGNKEYNKILSLKRAQSVANSLIKYSVDKSLIKIEYYGDGNPLVKTAENVANAKNRRVEIILK